MLTALDGRGPTNFTPDGLSLTVERARLSQQVGVNGVSRRLPPKTPGPGNRTAPCSGPRNCRQIETMGRILVDVATPRRLWRLQCDRRRTPVGGVQAEKQLRYVRLIAQGVNNSGWMHYYGRYGRAQLFPLLRRVSTYLRRWAARKYKRARGIGGDDPVRADPRSAPPLPPRRLTANTAAGASRVRHAAPSRPGSCSRGSEGPCGLVTASVRKPGNELWWAANADTGPWMCGRGQSPRSRSSCCGWSGGRERCAGWSAPCVRVFGSPP
jgi:hypothetical protein